MVGNNRVHYTATTIGLDKVNTVAVYENETTFVNDHYSSISQQNLVFLDVTGDFTHPVFKPGMNVIVIPTDIFADTKLHKVIELAVNSTGALNMSALPACLQGATFSGIDRSKPSISRHVESVINATVDLETAMAILNLTLTLASNESVTDGFRAKRVNACRLGVAADVLALIAWDGAIMRTQTDGGPMPGTWYGNVWGGIVTMFTLLWGGLVAIWNLFAQLFTALLNWGLEVVGKFAAAAMKAIELLIKALVLVLAYLLLAFSLLAIFCAFIVLIPVFVMARDQTHGQLIITSNMLHYWKDDKYFKFEFQINTVLIDFIDLNVPNLHLVISNEKNSIPVDINIFLDFIKDAPNLIGALSNFSEDASDQQASDAGLDSVKDISFTQGLDPEDNSNELFNLGFHFASAVMGASLAIYSSIAFFLSKDPKNKGLEISVFIFTLAAIVISAIGFGIGVARLAHSPEEIRSLYFGLYIGFFMSICWMFLFGVIGIVLPLEGASGVWDILTHFLTGGSIIATLTSYGSPESIIAGAVLDILAVVFGMFTLIFLSQDAELKIRAVVIFMLVAVGLMILFDCLRKNT
ncbi:MAG: hypothetical protein GYA24_08025 [Candidatus Lokiarchaeota archaeon]|nr:hypothetical protein [Candidatus Lokiarchaeota archaeon]